MLFCLDLPYAGPRRSKMLLRAGDCLNTAELQLDGNKAMERGKLTRKSNFEQKQTKKLLKSKKIASSSTTTGYFLAGAQGLEP